MVGRRDNVEPVRMAEPVEGVFVWDVHLRFTSAYDLPEGVHERAVIRCIQDAKTVKVQSIGRVHIGRRPDDGE